MPEHIPILLWCPACGERHIDCGKFATKPHHTHACQVCGMCWRPAIVPTVGVKFLPGFNDDDIERAVPTRAGKVGLVMPEKPTIHELEELLAEPGGTVAVLPDGSVVVNEELTRLRARVAELEGGISKVGSAFDDALGRPWRDDNDDECQRALVNMLALLPDQSGKGGS